MKAMRFAARTDFGSDESDYGHALRNARSSESFVDLTLSNPTRCGFEYPPSFTAALSNEQAMRYEADPLGTLRAREQIAALYNGNIPAEQLLLTASTSEAYGYLLRLFCEPGDAILAPSPSYPLFDLLARLHDVRLETYPLRYHDGWAIDAAALDAAVTPQTRAIIAVHPNNPTGNYCSAADRAALFDIAKRHNLPLIIDEVFLSYAIESAPQTSFADEQPPVLTFVLDGLSKLVALPQMKLAWMAACGPRDEVAEALARLEVIADTFLSVATPPQLALPTWLQHRDEIQQQIHARVRANLHALDEAITNTSVSRLRVDAGWSVVLRVPAIEDDSDLAIRLLAEQGIAVHPGSFYGFPLKGWLVISLLPQPHIFKQGLAKLLASPGIHA